MQYLFLKNYLKHHQIQFFRIVRFSSNEFSLFAAAPRISLLEQKDKRVSDFYNRLNRSNNQAMIVFNISLIQSTKLLYIFRIFYSIIN